jgi:hypothetical protein
LTPRQLPQIFTGYVALSEQPTRTDALWIGVEATAAEGFLSADATKSEVIKGLGLAIRAAVSDGSLSDTELARIQEIMNQFGLETNDIVASGKDSKPIPHHRINSTEFEERRGRSLDVQQR